MAPTYCCDFWKELFCKAFMRKGCIRYAALIRLQEGLCCFVFFCIQSYMHNKWPRGFIIQCTFTTRWLCILGGKNRLLYRFMWLLEDMEFQIFVFLGYLISRAQRKCKWSSSEWMNVQTTTNKHVRRVLHKTKKKKQKKENILSKRWSKKYTAY